MLARETQFFWFPLAAKRYWWMRAGCHAGRIQNWILAKMCFTLSMVARLPQARCCGDHACPCGSHGRHDGSAGKLSSEGAVVRVGRGEHRDEGRRKKSA